MLTHIKRYKKGAVWPDGEPRYCTWCGVLVSRGERGRRKQAVVIAVRGTLPVAYCKDHAELRGVS